MQYETGCQAHDQNRNEHEKRHENYLSGYDVCPIAERELHHGPVTACQDARIQGEPLEGSDDEFVTLPGSVTGQSGEAVQYEAFHDKADNGTCDDESTCCQKYLQRYHRYQFL
jgi:hypothetical protein